MYKYRIKKRYKYKTRLMLIKHYPDFEKCLSGHGQIQFLPFSFPFCGAGCLGIIQQIQTQMKYRYKYNTKNYPHCAVLVVLALINIKLAPTGTMRIFLTTKKISYIYKHTNTQSDTRGKHINT